MIILKDLFTLLATGEFSNIALSRSNTGGINESEYPKVIGHINLALIEIYKRFKLMENELRLNVTPSIPIYYLQDERIITSPPGAVDQYITLTAGQSSINIVEVTGMFDSDGNEMVMNNRHLTPNVQQLSADILKFGNITEAIDVDVIYQAYPGSIVLDDDFDPETYTLPISSMVLEAILYYVASRIYKPTGANNSTASADKSVSYQQQYELSCQKIEMLGLGIQNCDQANTFEDRGWA